MISERIDTSDIPEITDFTGAVKNPYYNKLINKGFSVVIHYKPKDAVEISKGICSRDIDLFEYDEKELEALDEYKRKFADAI